MKPNQKKTRQHWWGEYLNQTVVYVPLTAGEIAIVDVEDWPRIRQQYGPQWHCAGDGQGRRYACRSHPNDDGKYRQVTLQRAVLEAKRGQRVKTLNGNPLDCRRANLEIMTPGEGRNQERAHGR
ncbi:hypothetical protein MBHK15_130131 [Marinobacter salarius]|nr:hypothetical protein MBHK15_130131 [Marinobacter salarius]